VRYGGRVPPRSRTTNEPPLVLVVDDLEDNRDMYCEYLGFEGMRAISAANGKDAIDMARAHLPDLIVMDLTMPVMDGWEATRILKAGATTKGIPVVALTSHALRGSDDGALRAGCDDFVAKPCLPQDLAEVVKRWLAGKGRRRPVPQTGTRLKLDPVSKRTSRRAK
jgi:two-component system, cell cycle response regulator DivK